MTVILSGTPKILIPPEIQLQAASVSVFKLISRTLFIDNVGRACTNNAKGHQFFLLVKFHLFFKDFNFGVFLAGYSFQEMANWGWAKMHQYVQFYHFEDQTGKSSPKGLGRSQCDRLKQAGRGAREIAR
jgi:hypothetical protein